MADVKGPPLPGDVTKDCTIAFGVDTGERTVIMQFDRHVRAVALDEEQATELITALVRGLQTLGVKLYVGDDTAKEITH